MAKRRFDQNADRVDYGSLLIEDIEYELEHAVCLTYSLDMEALLGIPLCLGMRGEMTSSQRSNPLYVLEAIRRTGKKLSVFCNAGCIKVPKSESRLFALMEDCIHEVRMPNFKYNFHPKIWVVQYRNTVDNRTLMKVIVMSRNLTFDQSMDMAVEMAGFVGEKQNAKNQPLADMLQFVSQFDDKKNNINEVIKNLMHVEEFELLDCFDDYKFHPFGIYGKYENGIEKIVARRNLKTVNNLFENCDSLLVVSPFLSESTILSMLYGKRTPERRCLITRETSVTKRIFNAFNDNFDNGIWIVDPVFSSNDALEDNESYGFADRDIHAKVYYTEKYGEPHKLYVGSLNASHNAFNNNVEFLLELSYKSYYSSYQSVKSDFIPEKESPFVKMLSFDEKAVESDAESVDFREEIYSITAAEVVSNGEKFSLIVHSETDFAEVIIRPFYLKANAKLLTKEVIFEDVALNNLSNMFIISKGGCDCLVRLNVLNMPEQEREDAIFNDIIKNRPMFMTYMRYLLDEDFYDTAGIEEMLASESGELDYNQGYGFNIEPDIYEKMLRAAAENPERFDAMYEVVEKLEDDVIGEEFRQLLNLFMSAAGRKEKCRK